MNFNRTGNLGALILALLLSAFSSSAFAEGKAYDVIKYKAKVGSMTIALDYAAGYIEASELRITEAGKTTRFRLDESGEMHFVPDRKAAADKRVVLKLGIDDAPGPKIKGKYISGGETIAFVLVRK